MRLEDLSNEFENYKSKKMKAEDIEKNLQSITENGQHLSPILPEGIKNYLIDIDGTICDDIPNEPGKNVNSRSISRCIGNIE